MDNQYSQIKVEKTNVLRKSKRTGKMVPSMLDTYDIYDKRTMKSIIEKDESRDTKNYSKKKLNIIPNQNFNFYRYLIRKTIDQTKLFGPNNENHISVEYLTADGWKSTGAARPKSEYNIIMAVPSIDRNVPSGNYNNAIGMDEPIVMARINVFKL